MRIEQTLWTESRESPADRSTPVGDAAQLVVVFGAGEQLRNGRIAELRRRHPQARFIGCSTAGEIHGTTVHDDSIVSTAVAFESTKVRTACVGIAGPDDSRQAGRDLATKLLGDDLVHVFVLSDGTRVNGSELVRGLGQIVPDPVRVTGGLSADGARFKETLVLADGVVETGVVAAVGFYGRRLRVGCGCLGGWDSFGADRLVTRSKGNVLYELDGRPALQLYREYLGEQAAGLPATGLFYPLSLMLKDSDARVVRTLLAINEQDLSITFAGDIPQGSHARLMKANFDRLVDGAVGAAEMGRDGLQGADPDLAILISCVGRKLVLRQRVEEEVEGVRDVLGPRALLTGFYSYGEISPFTPSARCELHNQTMTITTFSER